VAARARQLKPAIKALLTSGYTEVVVHADILVQPGKLFWRAVLN
jgi:hypothetical protein